MGNVRLTIDFSSGLLEVEGPEGFVREMYSDFRASRLTAGAKEEPKSDVTKKREGRKRAAKPKTPQTKDERSTNKKKSRPLSQPKLLTDLDLSGGQGKPRLRDFYAEYEVTTNYQRNLIFTYYLIDVLGLEKANLDQIFTCYRQIPGVRVPKALAQSIRDTHNSQGWLDIDLPEDIRVSIAGLNYMEHDMPRKQEVG